MKKNEHDAVASPAQNKAKKPYSPPKIEKRVPVARVTLLSGMGNVGVGVISMMN